jgi:hypothetical protein
MQITLWAQYLLTKPLHQESFGVFPFSSKEFLGIQSLVQKQKSFWCLFKTNEYWKFKWFLRKVTIHLENLKKKTKKQKKQKHHEVTSKAEF